MNSTRQSPEPETGLPAELFRRSINLWPPFQGAGVRVTRVSGDYREIDVMLKLFALNRTRSGSQSGGSMFAMTDPFFALMMLMNLGSDFVVEDKAASIRYEAPAHGDVFARFRLAADAIDRARKATMNGATHEPVFRVGIVDRDDDVVAVVEKTLVIRRLESERPAVLASGRATRRRAPKA